VGQGQGQGIRIRIRKANSSRPAPRPWAPRAGGRRAGALPGPGVSGKLRRGACPGASRRAWGLGLCGFRLCTLCFVLCASLLLVNSDPQTARRPSEFHIPYFPSLVAVTICRSAAARALAQPRFLLRFCSVLWRKNPTRAHSPLACCPLTAPRHCAQVHSGLMRSRPGADGHLL
jgi:hypothetical protein